MPAPTAEESPGVRANMSGVCTVLSCVRAVVSGVRAIVSGVRTILSGIRAVVSEVRAVGSGAGARAGTAAILALLLLTGCDSTLDPPSQTSTVTAAPTTETSVSITPVTPDGLVTGPGVTDQTITLGVLIDSAGDRGLTDGIELWQQAVNISGGLCGRTVQLTGIGDDVSADPSAAYDAVGLSALGLISVPPPDAAVSVNSKISADQVPTLSPSGTSTQLGQYRPIVVGPTSDILTINALDYLERTGKITKGVPVGVLTDGSAAADNALQGAQWWAGRHDVALTVRQTGKNEQQGPDLADWGSSTSVLALTDGAETGRLAAAVASDVTVLTTVTGYDPDQWDAAALAVATAGRVLVSTSTPAYGSDYPAAVAVAARAAAAGITPGARLLDGYATGVSWARLLTQACGERTLTRQAIEQAAVAVGPASVDSLFGPSDPAQPVQSGLPATRVSAMSAANPAAVAGLTPLTWLAGASGIEDYVPGQ